MTKLIAVDLQYDFTRVGGKHFRAERICVPFIRERLIPYLQAEKVKIAEIISDYRQPRPGDLDDSCNPGTWGYKSEIPEDLVSSRWVKCMNSPYYVRENGGIAEARPGRPLIHPNLFYEWLFSFVNQQDTIVLFGLTLDCCVLCTAQAICFQGYEVRILLDATDTYTGGEKSLNLTMELVVSNWAKPISFDELTFMELTTPQKC